jgi:uncharacterized protein (TIGR00251 family)
MSEPIEATPGGTLLHLHVNPRSSRTAVLGYHGDRVKLAVAAPPVDGKANAEIEAWLAKKLGASKSQVSVTSGQSGRQKTVRIDGMTPSEVRDALDLD